MQTSSMGSQTVYEWSCPNCGCDGSVPLRIPHVLAVACQSCVKRYRAGEITWDQVYQAWLICNAPQCENKMCNSER